MSAPASPPVRPGVVAAVVVAALGLGLYVEGRNEIVEDEGLLYTYRWDWELHLFWASLVGEQGLPLVGSSGSPEVPLERFMHTGLLCSVAGIEQLTRTTPYQAARILALGCFVLIPLAGLTLVRSAPRPRAVLVVAGLAPLLWGSASLPFDLATPGRIGVRDPYASGAHPFTTASGAMYHNLTQLESVALAAAALAAVPGIAGGSWTLAAGLTGVSGLVKPTTAAVVGPALLLAALWSGAGWRTLARAAACFAAAGLLFAMPVLVSDPPPGIPAVIDTHGYRSLWSLRYGVWLGLSGVCAVSWLVRGRREGDPHRRMLALACLAGLALAAFWSEPSKRSVANESWGLNAALVLMAPLVVSSALGARALLLRGAGAALIALHVASAALYAWHYPSLERHGLPLSTRAVLERVRASTAPGTRVFVDMTLLPATGYAYLARPTPLPLHLVQTAERYDAETWRLINTEQRLPPQPLEFLARREAVVIGEWTFHLRPLLRRGRWRQAWSDARTGAQLWLRPLEESPMAGRAAR